MLSEYGRKMVDAHKRRMAAKPKVIFLPADMREEMKHARVIAAVSEGRIRVEPTGLFFIDAAGAVPGLASELTKALETIGAKIAAYRALGKTMAKIPGPVSTRARELANIFTIVGGSDEAPRRVHRRGRAGHRCGSRSQQRARLAIRPHGHLRWPCGGRLR